MRTVIRPHLLLDVVTGELLQDRPIVVDGDRIADVVAAGDAPAEGPAFVDLPGQTVLSGMIDCHTHLVGEPDGGHGSADLLTRTSGAGVASASAAGLDFLAGMGPENIEEFEAAMAGPQALEDWLSTEAPSTFAVTAKDVIASFGQLLPEVDKAALTGELAECTASHFDAQASRASSAGETTTSR